MACNIFAILLHQFKVTQFTGPPSVPAHKILSLQVTKNVGCCNFNSSIKAQLSTPIM